MRHAVALDEVRVKNLETSFTGKVGKGIRELIRCLSGYFLRRIAERRSLAHIERSSRITTEEERIERIDHGQRNALCSLRTERNLDGLIEINTLLILDIGL